MPQTVAIPKGAVIGNEPPVLKTVAIPKGAVIGNGSPVLIPSGAQIDGQAAAQSPSAIPMGQPVPVQQSALPSYAPNLSNLVKIPIGALRTAAGGIESIPSMLALSNPLTVAAFPHAAMSATAPMQNELDQAGQDIKSGNYLGAAGHALGAIPIVGPWAASLGETLGGNSSEIPANNPAAFRAPDPYQALGMALGGYGLGEAGKKIGDIYEARQAAAVPKALKKVTAAVRPPGNLTSWPRQLATMAPDLADMGRWAQQAGLPIETVDDQLRAIPPAKAAIMTHFNRAFDPIKQYATISGPEIADRIENAETQTARSPEAKGFMKKFEEQHNANAHSRNLARAEWYRSQGDIPIENTQAARAQLNSGLDAYYAKNRISAAHARLHPDTRGDVAEAEAIRDLTNRKVQELTGVDAETLMRRWGALTSLEKYLLNRKGIMDREAPISLPEQLGTSFGTARAAYGLATGLPGLVVEGAIEGGVMPALRRFNSPNRLIRSAVKTLAERQPGYPVEIPREAPRLALPRGPIPVSAIPDSSGARGVPAGLDVQYPGARALPAGNPPYGPIIAPPSPLNPVAGSEPTPTGGARGYTTEPQPDFNYGGSVKGVNAYPEPTTRAQRLGLLLGRGAIPLPSVPAENGIEVLEPEKIVVRNPKTGKMMRQYLGTGKKKGQ